MGVHIFSRQSLRIFFTGALFISTGAYPRASVHAAPLHPPGSDLPPLREFALRLNNGQADQVRGAYAPGLFADVVIQQPPGDPTFVAPRQHVLTQFQAASNLGSIGLLAHNNLAGARFTELKDGQVIYLLYGDGRMETYLVADVYRFQAVEPDATRSAFIDADGELLTADALFRRMYGRSGTLVFQTCIEDGPNSTWGRLFVVALPGPFGLPPTATSVSH